MELKKFTYESRYGSYPNCYFEVKRYSNGNIAIMITSEDEGPIAKCTTNSQYKLPNDRIAVKDWSENEGMERFLIKMDIIEEVPCDIDITTPMTPNIYKLTDKGLNLIRNSLKNTIND